MSRTRIKICGITRPEDALLASEAGADAVGFVFHPPAPRNVALDIARQIVIALPPFVTPVALFVNATTQRIRETVEALNVRHVQLHGDETAEQLAELRGLSLLKAVRVTRDSLADTLAHWRREIARHKLIHLRGLVLETGGQEEAGGTGAVNDWETICAAQTAGAFDDLPPIIAAGGLTPLNVERVARLLRPWAVDVSSGVEATRGIKSRQKVAAFVQAVRKADAAG